MFKIEKWLTAKTSLLSRNNEKWEAHALE